MPTPSITSVAKDVCKRIVPATQVVRFETKCLEVYGNLSSVSWVCHQLMVIFFQDFDSCWCCSRQNSLQSFSLSLSLLLSIHHYSHNCFSGVVVFGVAMSWRWLGRSLVRLGKVCMHTLHNWICHINVSMQLFSMFFRWFLLGSLPLFLRTLEAARQVTRTTPWVRFKFKVFCPECGKRVQPADVGEAQEMREVCQTMWRKFMQHLGPKSEGHSWRALQLKEISY